MFILLHGNGPGGKVSKDDVLAYTASSVKSPDPNGIAEPYILPDFQKFGVIERVPMRSVRRKTAQLMSLSWSKNSACHPL